MQFGDYFIAVTLPLMRSMTLLRYVIEGYKLDVFWQRAYKHAIALALIS